MIGEGSQLGGGEGGVCEETYQPEHGKHEVPVVWDPDVEERAHVRRDHSRADDEVMDLARGRDELRERARAPCDLRLEGALFQLRADELRLELARLVRVHRLGELPVVRGVEGGLGIE